MEVVEIMKTKRTKRELRREKEACEVKEQRSGWKLRGKVPKRWHKSAGSNTDLWPGGEVLTR